MLRKRMTGSRRGLKLAAAIPAPCLLLVLLLLLPAGCNKPAEPIHIGFIGGLTGRNADNGRAGHNGVVLAVEQANRSGGINGRQLVLDDRDDMQTADVAAAAARDLAANHVAGVIGPFTSSMAAVLLPVFDQAKILIVSPTISGLDFYGKDDYLLRINRTTRDNARDYARELLKRGQKRIAVGLDMRNQAFTESWLEQFRSNLEAIGGEIVGETRFTSSEDTDFSTTVLEMLSHKPDGLIFLAGAIDVARLSQQARRLDPQIPLSASEWAGTEQLIELGGKMVEGLVIIQNYNRTDESPGYLAFREAYYRRFKSDPGYSSVMAYDAATVLITALRHQQADESPKQAALRSGPYPGLQQEIVFDANGDTERKVYFTEIRNGKFELLQ